jgi:hypothetical protein
MDAIHFHLSPNLFIKRREAVNLTPLPFKEKGLGLRSVLDAIENRDSICLARISPSLSEKAEFKFVILFSEYFRKQRKISVMVRVEVVRTLDYSMPTISLF